MYAGTGELNLFEDAAVSAGEEDKAASGFDCRPVFMPDQEGLPLAGLRVNEGHEVLKGLRREDLIVAGWQVNVVGLESEWDVDLVSVLC